MIFIPNTLKYGTEKTLHSKLILAQCLIYILPENIAGIEGIY